MGGKPVFLVHKENKDFLQGKRNKPVLDTQASGWILPVFAVTFSLAWIALIIGAVVTWRDYIALRDAGVVVQGQYSDKRISSDSDSDSYYLQYTFVVNDVTYTDETSVSRGNYYNTEVGVPVDILYLPDNPRVSQVASRNTPPWALTGFAIFWSLMTGGLIFGTVIHNGRTRRLLKRGKVIRGEIERAEEHFDNDSDRWIHIDYLFQKPGTKDILTARYKFITETRKLPTRGTSVAVFYVDENTKRLL